jgi:hypothetical protein
MREREINVATQTTKEARGTITKLALAVDVVCVEEDQSRDAIK